MKRFAIGLVLLVIFLVGVKIWWDQSLLPVSAADKSSQTFVVASGTGIRELAKELKNKDLIRSPVSFFLLVKVAGLERKIQAGEFQLSSSMTTPEVAKALTHGIQDTWVTIPEGWRNEEIKDFLESKGFPAGAELSGNVVEANQGYLFPDTYRVPKESTVEQVFALMRQNFEAKVNFPVTPEQIVVASLVEREAKTATERPIIAGIIYNRLAAGMNLDIDATVQYALGKQQDGSFWKKDLTMDDLKIKSLYNTYQNTGLPPLPIANPGLLSIKAAVNPTKSDYLYYLHDKTGQVHFAKTLLEHNANIAKYL